MKWVVMGSPVEMWAVEFVGSNKEEGQLAEGHESELGSDH